MESTPFLQDNLHWIALAVASGAWLLFDMMRSANDSSQLSPMQATLLINREDAAVLDIRSQGEFDKGHIAQARHVPLADLSARLGDMNKMRQQALIVCCATGARTTQAINTLRKAGFEKLYNLRGGIMEWEKAGLPLTRKRKSK